jgi:preprotein translocase subunit SecA
MDHLKEGIGLRGYGQRDPLLEYKREAFELFEELEYKINADSVQRLFRIQLTAPEAAPVRRRPLARPLQMGRGAGPAPLQSAADGGGPIQPAEARPVTIRREAPKVGRNDPCPCGSGKKYKKCCGA